MEGCCECDELPCHKGFFAEAGEPAWRGLCIGSVRSVREQGLERYVQSVLSRMGCLVEYSDCRYRAPEEIVALLCGQEGT